MTADAQLLHAWREGNLESGQELFKRYYQVVSRFFINKVSEPPHDLVQETFMACVKGRDLIRDDRSFRSYLFGVAYKVLSGYLRRRWRFTGDLSSTSIRDLNPSPSTLMRKLERNNLLLDALRHLPVDLQVVIELRYWEKMNSTEIADVLGVSASTVRDRLQKGRRLLEQTMRDSTAASGDGEQAESIEVWAEKVREQMRGLEGSEPHPSR